MLLKVLVDKKISELPNEFTSSHKVVISMQLKYVAHQQDDKHFCIVMDAIDDDTNQI